MQHMRIFLWDSSAAKISHQQLCNFSLSLSFYGCYNVVKKEVAWLITLSKMEKLKKTHYPLERLTNFFSFNTGD